MLVGFEDEYRIVREAFEEVLVAFCPHCEVAD